MVIKHQKVIQDFHKQQRQQDIANLYKQSSSDNQATNWLAVIMFICCMSIIAFWLGTGG